MTASSKRKFSFTTKRIERLATPTGTPVAYWDATTPGFGIRVSPKGKKTWVLWTRIDDKPVLLTLGRFPLITLAAARGLASQKQEMVESGIDPRDEAQRKQKLARQTIGNFAEEYIDECVKQGLGRPPAKKDKPHRTAKDTEGKIRRYILPEWSDRPISKITAEDVADLLDTILKRHGGPTSNKVLYILRAIYNWHRDYKGRDIPFPFRRHMERAAHVRRKRFLREDEIRVVWQALDDLDEYPVTPYYRLCFLTGQRRNEVFLITEDEINWKTQVWTIPKERYKTERDHSLPLTDRAIELLQSLPKRAALNPKRYFVGDNGDGVSFSKMHERVRAAVRERNRGQDLERWTIHDIRRTVSTHMQHMGLAPHFIDAVQGHAQELPISGVYQVDPMLEHKLNSLLAWEDSLFNSILAPLHNGGARPQEAPQEAPGKAPQPVQATLGNNVVRFPRGPAKAS